MTSGPVTYQHNDADLGQRMIDAVDLAPHERLLPTQSILQCLYREVPDEFFPRLHNWCSLGYGKETLLDRYDIELPHNLRYEQLGSDPGNLAFIQMLLSMGGARSALEIGTFIGVSAMSFSEAMGQSSKVVTVEKFDYFADIAQRNLDRNGFKDRVHIVRGEALEQTASIQAFAPFDFIYLDGDKGQYDLLFDALFPMLSPKGVLIVDDALFHCDVLNEKTHSVKGAGVRRLLDRLREDESLAKACLPVGNGVILVRRR